MFLIAAMVFAADRLVKLWAHTELRAMPGGELAWLPGVFHLRYATNDGVSFGLLSGKMELLAMVQIFMCAALLVVLVRKRAAPWLPVAAGWLTLGGALGNLYDRIRFGFVIDLFEIRLFRFAIFNVADVCLCVGIGAFALWTLLHRESGAYEPVVRR
ncbi:MAG: signal peptidase II [Oscillospiraceae bacterium]|jgi:signal peptidase II|nr:signal peptidase II [Oscillospiraceae bacterium]